MYMHMSMSMCVCGVWSVECARQGAYSSHSDVGDVWDMKWCVGGVRTRHATAGRLRGSRRLLCRPRGLAA